jgi:hypothetical protein
MADDVRHELVRLLLEKVHDDPYPSTTMLDLIEELIGPDERADYAAVLMEKIRGDNFPSLDMMSRVRDLA